MSKLTPTTIILLIAGLGAAILLVVYYRKKKAKKAVDPAKAGQKPAPATDKKNLTANRGFAPMRLVKTPVGFIKAV